MFVALTSVLVMLVTSVCRSPTDPFAAKYGQLYTSSEEDAYNVLPSADS